MPELIEFRPPSDEEGPQIRTIRKPTDYSKPYCDHTRGLEIDSDTQLVTCKCGLVMSAYSALMILVENWERMKFDTTEWRKMKEEQSKAAKSADVRRRLRELQWIELPGEDEPEARGWWQKLTEAMGREPYAMFRRHSRGKTIQFCVLDDHGGYTDAGFLIECAKRKPALVKPAEAENV